MSKTELVKGGPWFPSRKVRQSIPTFLAPSKIPEKISCRFKAALFHYKQHPKEAGLHVSLHIDNNSSVSTTKLCPWSCFWPIMYRQHVLRFRFLRNYSSFRRMCLHVTGLQTFIAIVFGVPKPRMDSTTRLSRRKVTVLIAVYNNDNEVHTTLIINQWEESNIIRFSTLTPCQKLNNSSRVLFSAVWISSSYYPHRQFILW